MKTAIMQPYFLAYIGYYQLINAVDKFVIYDNIEYTKKGWFNKNRILLNGKDKLFTIPLKSDSDYLNVDERYIAESYEKGKPKIIRWINNAYEKAPYYKENNEFIESLFDQENNNLFDFIHSSVRQVCDLLKIETEIIQSSKLPIDHSLKSEERVLAICQCLNTDIYINAIGGKELYSKEVFRRNNISLSFLRARKTEYEQFSVEFLPWLSIIDVLFFNGVEKTKEMLYDFDLE